MAATIAFVALWIGRIGYGAVFAVLFIESVGVPSPSEIILLFSGYLVYKGTFSYPLVVLFGAAGSISGATVAYWIARLGGRPLILKRLSFIFKSESRLQYWENYFRRQGDRVILIGRIISGVRMVISYPAGLFEMPFWRFFTYTVIGSILWPLIAVTAGVILGPHVKTGLEAMHRYELPAVIVIALLIAAWWFWDRRRKRQRYASGK
ncbi:MAG: DedA family protein [Sulfobacillus sp.]